MIVCCKGIARIRHVQAGQIHEINSSELEWVVVGSDALPGGIVLHHEAAIEDPELGVLTWSLWEYPEGVVSFQSTEVGGHELLSDIEFWLEQERPEQPISSLTRLPLPLKVTCRRPEVLSCETDASGSLVGAKVRIWIHDCFRDPPTSFASAAWIMSFIGVVCGIIGIALVILGRR